MISVACLSQKGGVGKSTLARLIASFYAGASWQVKIADFNVRQKTSVDWSALRMEQKITPEIPAEAFNDPERALRASDVDLLVCDGKPDADTQTMRLAQAAVLSLIPCGLAADDLVPQIRFAQELKMRGVRLNRIMFVLNKVTDSEMAVLDARNFIARAGFDCTQQSIPMKTAYLNAHNSGRCLLETDFPTLNSRAEGVAREIVDRITELMGAAQ